MDAKQVTDIFWDAGLIKEEQAHAFVQEVVTTDKSIDRVIIDHDIVNEDQFYQTIADSLGTEVVDLSELKEPAELRNLIPGGLARLHGAMPVGASENTIYVALIDPLN